MSQKQIIMDGPVRSADFVVREDFTMALRLGLAGGERYLVFHDFIKKGRNRYCLFHGKAAFSVEGNSVIVRTAAVNSEDGAPIPGLLVTYRFAFDKTLAAFYLSASFGCDTRLSGYTVKLMDVSWENMEIESFTGYEYDAEDKPFSHTFSIPEPNPDAPDYDTLLRITPHAAWERMKTRPHTFKKAVSVKGCDGYLAVYGGTPTFHVEAKYMAVFSQMEKYDADLRYFSGKNSPGAWFILEEQADMFAVMEGLDKRVPTLPEHVLMPFCKKAVVLESGELKQTLLQTNAGIWIDAVSADGKKAACQPWPLFCIDLWDTQYERALQADSGEGWDRVDILEKKNYVRVTLSDPENGKVAGITVVAEAFMDPGRNRISWSMRVVDRSDRWSVTDVSYPQCLAHGYSIGFSATGSGSLHKLFHERTTVYRGKYPTGSVNNMGFTALYNPVPLEQRKGTNGLYMGVHDPDGNRKFVYLAGAPQSRCAMMTAQCAANYQRQAGNSFTLPGQMVIQKFSGDWFDAANIYREFVHTQAVWFPKLRGRPDTPQWMRQMPVWIMHFMPNENPDANPFPITLREKYPDKNQNDWYKTAIRFREQIGVPVAYHLYNWHWVPFNNDNPHYFPAHHDLKEGMRELKNADIRVIPYIAGYSWDMRDRRGDDYRFEQEALAATAKDINGNVIFSSYASTEPNGIPVRFARMCPSTTTWKNEVRQIVRRLYSDYGMDGIYLDVVSAAYDHCCDENHLHAPGQGSFWWKCYAELIAGLRADAPEDFAIVSESTSEVYSGALDGYLSWTWVQIDGVPAYSRVYGGRTAIFGRVITQNKRDDVDYFRFNIAQSLLYGQQLGWIHPEIVDDPVQFPFLKKMAAIRWDNCDFFAEAEMLRPPVVEGKMSLLDCEAYLRGQIWNHEKLAMAGAWEDASGKRSLFVINAGGSTAEVTVSVYEDEYDLPEIIDAFDTQDGFKLLGMESENGIRKLHCRIAPEGVGILNWT